MMAIEAVYLPHNEPYLGREKLLEFDIAIPSAMQKSMAIAARTFEIKMSPQQEAISEIVPQGISIALSIRELIRQGYLFSAAILLRPLIERTALVFYLIDTPEAVVAWHNGWPRGDQPSLPKLIKHLSAREGHLGYPGEKELATMLHKVVHSDPMAAQWNITSKHGRVAYASGKTIDAPDIADFCATFGKKCLQHLLNAADIAFPEIASNSH
jgi:hypothetical protein